MFENVVHTIEKRKKEKQETAFRNWAESMRKENYVLTSYWVEDMIQLLKNVDAIAQKKDAEGDGEDVYSFFIDALGQELAGHYTYFAMSKYGSDLKRLVKFPGEVQDFLSVKKESGPVQGKHIAYFPWSVKRIRQSLADVKANGYCRDKCGSDICKSTYYPEFDFCTIENVHHHAAAAGHFDNAHIMADTQIIDINGVFDVLFVDNWFRWKSERFPEVAKCPVDPRFSAMYELARRRNVLRKIHCP